MVSDSDGRRDAYMNKATEEDLRIIQRILEIAGVPKWEYSINASQENTLCFFLIDGEIHVFVPERNENKGLETFSDWKSAIEYAIPFWDDERATSIKEVVKTLEHELSRPIKDEEPITGATDAATEPATALTASDTTAEQSILSGIIKKKTKAGSPSQSEWTKNQAELEKAIAELRRATGDNDTFIQRWLQRVAQSVQKMFYGRDPQLGVALSRQRIRQMRKQLVRQNHKQKKQDD